MYSSSSTQRWRVTQMDNKYAKMIFLRITSRKAYIMNRENLGHVLFLSFCLCYSFTKMVVPLVSGGDTFTGSICFFCKSACTNNKSDEYATSVVFLLVLHWIIISDYMRYDCQLENSI